MEDLAALFMCASLKPSSIQHLTRCEIYNGKQSLAKAAQSGSEGDAVLFFHSPPPSVKHLLPLHDQFNFLSGCAV